MAFLNLCVTFSVAFYSFIVSSCHLSSVLCFHSSPLYVWRSQPRVSAAKASKLNRVTFMSDSMFSTTLTSLSMLPVVPSLLRSPGFLYSPV